MDNAPARKVDALLFDKDGTLFEFSATWDPWAHGVIEELTAGDAALAGRLAEAMHYDLAARRFHPTSPIIAGTNREAAECVATALPGRAIDELEVFLAARASTAPLSAPVPLAPFLDGLAMQGLALGVMTNDAESSALAQLETAGITRWFGFIAGFDSGHGAKPAPDPLLAFARAMQLAPDRVAMVGDSTHDLIAGRAAGMQTIAVLTGTATTAELLPHADVVLDHIGHIPAWLQE